MKVLCIDGVRVGTPSMLNAYKAKKPDCLAEGEIYTVLEEMYFLGRKCYTLDERNPMQPYLASRFIPLSNIDEMELVNENYKTVSA